MARLPLAAASRNMSACSAQAISHVGCRLMVASSANTKRPLAPALWGDIARALATKAAMSSDADGLASGSGPARAVSGFGAADTSDLGTAGSWDIYTRIRTASMMWGVRRMRSMRKRRTVLILLLAPKPQTFFAGNPQGTAFAQPETRCRR